MRTKTNKKSNIISVADFKKLPTRKKKDQKEQRVQLQVCDYLKKHYPDVIFMCDLASGMNVGKRIGGMNTRFRSSRGLPDLFIGQPLFIEPVDSKCAMQFLYGGLFIELKRKEIRLKSGALAQSPHMQEQREIRHKLRNIGFCAEIACGFDEAKKIIDDYLKTR